MTRTGDLLDSRMPRSRDHSLEGRIARPVSVASPATLGRYHTRVGRSASCTGRGISFPRPPHFLVVPPPSTSSQSSSRSTLAPAGELCLVLR
ncbi:hypothetical protein Hamer_G027033 [Homarus americanus]|uniref:Uncharacterized protein n=1 Tax=Homarus americanus TaxID=6706 RepID=A0A8J5MJT1_HOMAM|nr:hypothetical protein Hamer_G027033 [Homarus americanus]